MAQIRIRFFWNDRVAPSLVIAADRTGTIQRIFDAGIHRRGSQRRNPDPFGMDLSAYEACRDSMVEAIPSLIRVVEKLYKSQLTSRSDDR